MHRKRAISAAALAGVLFAALIVQLLWVDPVLAPPRSVSQGNVQTDEVSRELPRPPEQHGPILQPEATTTSTPQLNDPRSGRFRLRVIDDLTGQPIPNARCRMFDTYNFAVGSSTRVVEHDELLIWYRPNYDQEQDAQAEAGRPGWLNTDAAGEIDISLQFTDDENEECGPTEATSFGGDSIYPLPEGYAPFTRPRELAGALVRAWANPTEGAVDVRVRPLGRILGRVVDPEGNPVEGAIVRAGLHSDERWAEHCYPELNTTTSVAQSVDEVSWWSNLAEGLARCESVDCEPVKPAIVRSTDHYAVGETIERLVEYVSGFDPPVVSDAGGNFEFRAAPGIWDLVVSGGGHDSARTCVEHTQDDTTLTFVCKRQCALTLRIDLFVQPDEDNEIDPSDEPESDLLFVRIAAVSPMESPDTEYSHEWELEWQGQVDPQGASTVELRFTGIPPIWMAAEVRRGEAANARHFLMRPGEDQNLRVALGEGEVQLELPAGTPSSESLSLVIETPPTIVRTRLEFLREEEFRSKLAPGTYVAHLPDNTYVPFEVTHGATTRLHVAALFSDTEFLLAGELEVLLGAPVTLALDPIYGDGYRPIFGPEYEGTVPEFFRAAHGADSRWNFVQRRVVVRTCPDVYFYTLSGPSASVSGLVDLRARPASLRLSQDSLPGLARVDLSVVSPWSPTVTHRLPGEFGGGWGRSVRRGDIQQLGGVARVDGSRFMLWAPPGDIDVIVSAPQGSTEQYCLPTSVPGRLHVDLSKPKGTVEIVDDSSPVLAYLFVQITGSEGTFYFNEEIDTLANETESLISCIVPVGHYSLRVERRVGGEIWRGVWEGPVGEGRRTIKWDDLKPIPLGPTFEAVLTCSGLTSTFDGPISPKVRAAIDRLRLARPIVYRAEGSRWRVANVLDTPYIEWGTAELREVCAYSNQYLQPGKYRLEAWPGAPARYRKEFEVADQHVKVEISLD